ncbi:MULTISPECIES: SRPBCC family protein [unclassified Brachybacterium]|uniref:SRPBCC family protein n=1 Tax=unclassified Brachybacterium TaxID=2623841 RepID=UPI003621DF71
MTTEENKIVVSRVIDAPAKDLFDLLSLPARHPDVDGSGMVRSAENTERVTKAGEQFTMNMYAEGMGGDYRMRNHVTAFDENKMIGWKPAREESPDDVPGWEWLYELKPLDAGTTEVTLTYDWSDVTDPKLLPIFPGVPEEDLEESLNKLAAAVTNP